MDLNQHFQHKWGISYHQATWIPHTLYWSKEKANPSPPAFHSFLPFLLWLSQFFLSSFRKFSSKHLASCMWQKKLRSSLERVYFWITDKPTELSDLSSSWNLGWSPKSLFSTEQPKISTFQPCSFATLWPCGLESVNFVLLQLCSHESL